MALRRKGYGLCFLKDVKHLMHSASPLSSVCLASNSTLPFLPSPSALSHHISLEKNLVITLVEFSSNSNSPSHATFFAASSSVPPDGTNSLTKPFSRSARGLSSFSSLSIFRRLKKLVLGERKRISKQLFKRRNAEAAPVPRFSSLFFSSSHAPKQEEFEGNRPPLGGAEFFVNSDIRTMKAAVLQEDGSFLIETLKIPEPKPGEILIKTRACGVCHTDLSVSKGLINFPKPCVLGHEVSGEILEYSTAGMDAPTRKRFPIGCKVVGAFIMPCGHCPQCLRGAENLCEPFFETNRLKGRMFDGETRLFRANDGDSSPLSLYSMGGFAEYCVVPLNALCPLPTSLSPSFANSSVLGCAVFTAYGAVYNAARLVPGESVVVLGGGGGVGISIVQLCHSLSPSSVVISVDRSEEKLNKSLELGATHAVNLSAGRNEREEGEILQEKLREILGSSTAGVDVSFEAIGRSQTIAHAFNSLRDGGRLVMVGIAAPDKMAEFPILKLVRRNISVLGSYGANARTDLPAIVRLVDSGRFNVDAMVTGVHPLDRLSDAFDALREGKVLGRSIVDMEIQ